MRFHKKTINLTISSLRFIPKLASNVLIGITTILISTAFIYGQANTAEIRGTIKDSSGGLLPGFSLTVEHISSGFKLERVSDGSGKFLFPALPVGEYVISAQASGFKKYSQNGIALQIG